MTFANGRTTLAIPGPSPLPDRVLRAMARPSPDIYSGELPALNLRLMAGLKRLAGTRAHLAAYIGNGHAGWEAAIANLFHRGERALVLTSGHFGHGWARAAQAMGVEVEIMDFAARAADPAQLAERLAADKDHLIKAVLVCHIDTATSVQADLMALKAAIGDHPALFAVDAIASLGCAELCMDDWGIDVLVSASQKGLMSPPGAAFVWFSERAKAMGPSDIATPYWNWHARAEATELWQFWDGTAPVQMIYAANEALTMILDEESLPAVWARHEGLARAVWAAFEAWGKDGSGITLTVAEPSERARSVTAATLPRADELRAWCDQKAGLVLGLGLGAEDAANALRVAHMGHANAHQILGTLAVMEAGMTALAIPHGAGAIEAAARVIAERA